MEQTYGFFGFILYLLTFLGCNGTTSPRDHSSNSSSPPSITEKAIEEKTEEIAEEETIRNTQHGTDYYLSLEKWNQEKEKHNDSYAYTLFFASAEGAFSFTTIVTVKNGAVYSRERKEKTWDSKANKMMPSKKGSWTENEEQLGTHGKTPKTMDELYKDCGQTLTVDPNIHKIVFTMNNEQLMSACGATNEACADDCFKGVRIIDFKWLN